MRNLGHWRSSQYHHSTASMGNSDAQAGRMSICGNNSAGPGPAPYTSASSISRL